MQNILEQKIIDAEIVKQAQRWPCTDFARGSVALLHYLKLKVRKAIDDCNSRFTTINKDSRMAESLQDEDSSSTESDSDDSEDDQIAIV